MVGGRQTHVIAVKVFLFQRRDRQQNRKHSAMVVITERSGQTDTQAGHGAGKVWARTGRQLALSGWAGMSQVK